MANAYQYLTLCAQFYSDRLKLTILYSQKILQNKSSKFRGMEKQATFLTLDSQITTSVRRALVGSRTPLIWCLSNARSGDLHFGTSFVALRALVREIIPNTIHTHIHTYIHTYMTQVGFPSIV